MPTASQLKETTDSVITNKTLPYSIDNKDVGQLLKDIITFMDAKRVDVIPFLNQAYVIVDWTDDRKIKFGSGAKIVAEILGDDGKYRQTANLEIVPNDIVNTTSYTVDLGGSSTGRLLIG